MSYKKDYEEWLDDQLKGKSSADAYHFITKEFLARVDAVVKNDNISYVAKGMMIGSVLSSIPFLAITDMHPKFGYLRYDDGSVVMAKYDGPSLTYRAAKAVGLGANAAVFVAGAVTFVASRRNIRKEHIKEDKLLEKLEKRTKIAKEEEKH